MDLLGKIKCLEYQKQKEMKELKNIKNKKTIINSNS